MCVCKSVESLGIRWKQQNLSRDSGEEYNYQGNHRVLEGELGPHGDEEDEEREVSGDCITNDLQCGE